MKYLMLSAALSLSTLSSSTALSMEVEDPISEEEMEATWESHAFALMLGLIAIFSSLE